MKRFIAIIMTLCLVLGMSSVSVWAAEEATWQTENPMPTARYGADSCVVGDKIYVIGGNGADRLNAVEIYNTKTNTWSTAAPMPTARGHLTASAVGDKIYVIGGANSNDLSTLEIYNTNTNTWSTGEPMPTARQNLSASVVGDKIYAIGGYHSKSLNNLEIYDTQTNTWSTGKSMPTARHGLSTSVIGDKIYAIGGYNGSRLKSVEIYDTKTDSWTTGKSLTTEREGLSTSVIAGKIYAIGGYNSNNLATIEIYDPNTNTWDIGQSMITARLYLNSEYVNGKIYTIGGSIRAPKDQAQNILESLQVANTNIPSTLEAVASTSAIVLNWNSVDGATSYNVKRSIVSGGPYETIKSNITDVSYTDSSIELGTTYYYIVVPVISGVEGTNSNEALAKTDAPPQPQLGNALLTITYTDGLTRTYDVPMSTVNDFISWYEGIVNGNGKPYFKFQKAPISGAYTSRIEYVIFDKISNFDVDEYSK